ncbi:hypothetical protein AJ85_15180 [Alkalihalobacillus alcalophilus ATCC 27647 = CGMCC 1.3604]|uniref:NADPH-dependent FMN reductase-like domain-containing protein n=1 Tax=Alkalihalobacillus alcalophilus ATCC 27647 = CGMCC 1.3604 TaxID=1218173 RepID=A0A094XIW6_ALKAL|nr:hypothetical protein [Alkalihalobacillus alcalophilus]KGA98690.1 hypothetical protein BALCAV_0202760 [Alkalihalobacillus alcalophilus ATCC 27647 = CGMCC 1.3604]MED1560316.1 hypothetical protein [Alkalihalobacillus alcalophilus]THG89761.1 hypothetical protein AJ85_15180 [Alkalihalobacillus alcalophilus ATCC 27647 = CGMCC 1.3604]
MSYQITIIEVPTKEPSLGCIHTALKSQLDKFGDIISSVSVKDFSNIRKETKALQAIDKANLVVLLFEAKERPYKEMKDFLNDLDKSIFKGKMILPAIIGGTRVHASVIEFSLKPVLISLATTELIPTIYVMDETKKSPYPCERKESEHEIKEYLFSILKKHIPITYYI